MTPMDVQVRGHATAEELAAIVAALQTRQRREPAPSRLEQWRRLRQEVLRDNR
jgi:Acyl-CoA carboxylase epsilon subunit